MESIKKEIQILNKMKNLCKHKSLQKVTNEAIATFTENKLSAEQVGKMLSLSDESLLTPDNMDILRNGVYAAKENFIEKLSDRIVDLVGARTK